MNFTKVLKEFPVIETEKIRLRKLREEDAPELLKYYSNEINKKNCTEIINILKN
ncbi:GNAT family N-acetyltransferase [Desnuesiella massiliensis]|uniref:GNAT family N-acetyltransferase n=1 Tax=Desnuesiella massiliensis TaxID=1650662 RepID=UPI0012B52E01|nr:hypothetical protein [Desnuesiella massiliensis]